MRFACICLEVDTFSRSLGTMQICWSKVYIGTAQACQWHSAPTMAVPRLKGIFHGLGAAGELSRPETQPLFRNHFQPQRV